jgi:hypothetical protein
VPVCYDLLVTRHSTPWRVARCAGSRVKLRASSRTRPGLPATQHTSPRSGRQRMSPGPTREQWVTGDPTRRRCCLENLTPRHHSFCRPLRGLSSLVSLNYPRARGLALGYTPSPAARVRASNCPRVKLPASPGARGLELCYAPSPAARARACFSVRDFDQPWGAVGSRCRKALGRR